MGELLPCPFCGSEPMLHCNDGDPKHKRWYAICRNCYGTGGDSVNKPDAISAWNARAPQWRPVTDEQRNGEPWLMWGKHVGYNIVFWDDPDPMAATHHWWHVNGNHAYHDNAYTHYQPLPSPPTEQEG